MSTLMNDKKSATMPSQVSSQVSFFDRMASAASKFASRAWFFAMCVTLVVVWFPSIAIIRNIDTWQLVINTATTIITFLLVALFQNSESRANDAVQQKLNAVATALLDIMQHLGNNLGPDDQTMSDARAELADSIGLERRESS